MELTEIVALVLALMKVFELVARLTPSTRDDDWVQKMRRFSAIMGLAVPDKQGRSK